MLILPSVYLPNVLYFAELLGGERVLIEHHEHYIKQTFRNRCEIFGANGRLALTVPVRRPHGNHTPIGLVEVDYAVPWRNVHWRSIKSAYGTSAYFEFVADVLEPLFGQRHGRLIDLNMAMLGAVLGFMGLRPDVGATLAFEARYDAPHRDQRGMAHKAQGRSGVELLRGAPYYQVFASRHGFMPNLSIIDLLFNEGLGAAAHVQHIVELLRSRSGSPS